MSYERDDYMRRQEAEHDMIRMRTPPAPRCNCAARFYGDDRNAHQLCCATKRGW